MNCEPTRALFGDFFIQLGLKFFSDFFQLFLFTLHRMGLDDVDRLDAQGFSRAQDGLVIVTTIHQCVSYD